MKIKYTVSMAGPNTRILKGQEIEVSEAKGNRLIAAGVAKAIAEEFTFPDDLPEQPIEKAEAVKPGTESATTEKQAPPKRRKKK